MPGVSVIIPVYNTSPYLRRCLDSVTAQTLRDIEIICVNDGSTDNSLDILREYEQKDRRITVIDLGENCGVSIARNTGIDAATGEYIGFVDSDDYVDVDFYEKLYNETTDNNADCIKGCLKQVDELAGEVPLFEQYDLNDKIRQNKVYFYCSFTTAIYKTSFLKDNNIKFPVGISHFEDPNFSIHAALLCNTVRIVDNTYYYYLMHTGSETHQKSNEKKVLAYIESINLIIELLNSINPEKPQYLIIYEFIISNFSPWCYHNEIDDAVNETAVRELFNILKKSNYPEDCLAYYFLERKRKQQESTTQQLSLAKLRGNVHSLC